MCGAKKGQDQNFRANGPDLGLKSVMSWAQRGFGLGLRSPREGQKPGFRVKLGGVFLQKVWSVTVIVRTFFRYYLTSDIFGLAYLVGQIED